MNKNEGREALVRAGISEVELEKIEFGGEVVTTVKFFAVIRSES